MVLVTVNETKNRAIHITCHALEWNGIYNLPTWILLHYLMTLQFRRSISRLSVITTFYTSDYAIQAICQYSLHCP